MNLINADGYGSRLGLGKGLTNSQLSGGISAILNSGRLRSQSSGLTGSGYAVDVGPSSEPITAAIETRRKVELVPVHTPKEEYDTQIIEVPANELPVAVLFKSKSSRIFVDQIHIPGSPGELQQTRSEDEPHYLRHEVVRPVIQELREVIQPYRRVVQQIQPVIEELHQVVARGEQRRPNTAPISAVRPSGLRSSPIRTSIDRGLGAQRVVETLSDRPYVGYLNGKRIFAPIRDNQIILPLRVNNNRVKGKKLGGALSGLVLDNGLNDDLDYGSNVALLSVSPFSPSPTHVKYLATNSEFNSHNNRPTYRALGVAPPGIDLGGVPFLSNGLSGKSKLSYKQLEAYSAVKSKAA